MGFGARGQGILTAPLEKSVEIFSLRHKKLILIPIFRDQSLQHTGFAPLFTQLTNETSHFAPLSQIVLQKCLFFRPLYAIFTPIFVNNYEKALKILFGHRFWPP